jgi:hypothetical protein
MYTLSDDELKKIISWQPYRQDWPVDRNSNEIEEYFGDLKEYFEKNASFECVLMEDGGVSNYLEFIFYPLNKGFGKIDAIMLCVSLCAPIAAYSQVDIYKEEKSFGYGFIKAEIVGVIESDELRIIEQLFLPQLKKKGIQILNAQEASQEISSDIYSNENYSISLSEGNQLIHALFQWMD